MGQSGRFFQLGQFQVGGDYHGPAAVVAAVNDRILPAGHHADRQPGPGIDVAGTKGISVKVLHGDVYKRQHHIGQSAGGRPHAGEENRQDHL